MLLNNIQYSKNSPAFSRIVTGVWKWGNWGAKLETEQITELIDSSVEVGITTFDHADIYGDYMEEERFGKAFKKSRYTRDKIQLITKCGIKLTGPNRPKHSIHSYDTSKKHILLSVENSLAALGTDYIDLLLIHRPSPFMSPHEIAEAFEELIKSGKVRSVGVSNFTTDQFETLNGYVELVTNQIEASLAKLDPFLDGTVLQCQKYRVRPMAWSPLGSGTLMTTPETDKQKRIDRESKEICEKYNCKKAELLLAFLLNHPSGIVPVLGTSKPERIQTASTAAAIKLERDDWFKLWVASTGEKLP